VRRGELWWATLPRPVGSGPGYRRPVVVAQSNDFNESRIQTVLCVAVTSNVDRARAPGNVLLKRRESHLKCDSVANVSQLITLDKTLLTERISVLDARLIRKIEDGLRLVLAL
jgi:mRNA interferase MazF